MPYQRQEHSRILQRKGSPGQSLAQIALLVAGQGDLTENPRFFAVVVKLAVDKGLENEAAVIERVATEDQQVGVLSLFKTAKTVVDARIRAGFRVIALRASSGFIPPRIAKAASTCRVARSRPARPLRVIPRR